MERRLPDWVVCPQCHGALTREESLACTACGATYAVSDGIPNFLVGPRFDDESSPDRDETEESMDDHIARNYLVPLLGRLGAQLSRPLRVLSVGCGVGRDVDVICEAGHEGVGIDCGSRVRVWSGRASRARFLIASGRHLPFEDGAFDFVFAGCVLAHVGVVGDSCTVGSTWFADRAQFCSEAARVTATGGQIVLSGPNRWCPVDLFHRPRGYLPRFHGPTERFLPSFADIRRLFRVQPGYRGIAPLPTAGYWRFNGLLQRRGGAAFGAALTWYFKAISWSGLPFLRRTCFNPWLIVRIEK